MKIHLWNTICTPNTLSSLPTTRRSILFVLRSFHILVLICSPNPDAFSIHSHKSRLFVVLIGIIRATHIQTQNKQIDGKESGEPKSEKKNFSIAVTPRTLCFNETHYLLMVYPQHMHIRAEQQGKVVNEQQQPATPLDVHFYVYRQRMR